MRLVVVALPSNSAATRREQQIYTDEFFVTSRPHCAGVSFPKRQQNNGAIREKTAMGQSRLSRRAVLKTAALGSAAVITAPYVSGVHPRVP